MFTPITEEFQSSKSPWEVFCAVYQTQTKCFFLDSHTQRLPDQNYSYIGFAPFLEVSLDEKGLNLTGEIEARYPHEKLSRVLRSLFKKYAVEPNPKKPYFSGGAVGYLTYEMAEFFEKISFDKHKPGWDDPALYLGFYRDLIVFDHARQTYTLVTHLKSKVNSRRLREQAVERISRLKSFFASAQAMPNLPDRPSRVRDFKPVLGRAEFKSKVQKAKDYISAGDIYQANLSQRFRFKFDGSSLKLYEDLRNINPSPFSSFLKVEDLEVISSSPERLIRKKGHHCETRPIAGTRPTYLEGELLANEKERAEHVMLIDLERNDLGRVCDFESVRVEEMMAIERYSHVVHIVSKITGQLSKGKDFLNLIQTMFPGGTITGCPKVRCMEIIEELEPVRRGLYTGSVGYLGFDGDMDLNIVIRTIVLKKGRGFLQVGAGIVHDSDPEKEYEETLHKGEALIQALSGVGVL